MILRISRYGEPILRQPSLPVTTFDDDLARFAADMIETMRAAQGIGLAAQQVGDRRRLCIVDVAHLADHDLDYQLDGRRPPIDLIMPLALVNPRVTLDGPPTEVDEEGCLSFPDLRGDVARSLGLRVEYQDLRGATHHLACRGWFARVIQHEVDHLDGVLFIDRMDSRSRKRLDARLKLLETNPSASSPHEA